MGEPQSQSVHRGYRKNLLLLPGMEPRTPGRPVRSQTPYWLSYRAHYTSIKKRDWTIACKFSAVQKSSTNACFFVTIHQILMYLNSAQNSLGNSATGFINIFGHAYIHVNEIWTSDEHTSRWLRYNLHDNYSNHCLAVAERIQTLTSLPVPWAWWTEPSRDQCAQ
jgi:hypothetical protein